jgi:signal transduction histidine kinase
MRFDRSIATALFRVLQEALTNVARHAQASHVDVSLICEDTSLKLEVKDDGIGIDSDAVSRATSLGLLGIHERARRLGGTASVEGKRGAGTRVAVEVPLAPGGVA